MSDREPSLLRVSLVIALAFAGLGVVVGFEPSWWRKWGSLVAAFTTAAVTTVLVVVTQRYVKLTGRLSLHAELQATLSTLPIIGITSSYRRGKVTLRNHGAPAMNVEFRILTEKDDVVSAHEWEWVNAMMAKGGDDEKDRPRGVHVHAQVRLLDSLGTLYLFERRYLGSSAVGAYRVFRYYAPKWYRVSVGESQAEPLEVATAAPRLLDVEREED